MNIPVKVKKALNAASGVKKCYVNCSYSQNWLTDNFSLFTDCNEHTIENFVVDFCWISQKWFVRF